MKNFILFVFLFVGTFVIAQENENSVTISGGNGSEVIEYNSKNYGRFSSLASLISTVTTPVLGDEAVIADYPLGGVASISNALVQYNVTTSQWERLMSEELNEITLVDPYDATIPELAAIPIADLFKGDRVTLRNYFNDIVDYKWDGTDWCRETLWRVKCVVKLNTATGNLEILENTGHTPIGINPTTGITNNTGTDDAGFKLLTPHITGSQILTNSATVDETNASLGVQVGSSVGTVSSDFNIYSTLGISGRIFRQSGTGGPSSNGWRYVSSASSNFWDESDFTFDFDNTSGNLTITHPVLTRNISDVQLTPGGTNAQNMRVVSNLAGTTIIRFYDVDNNVITTESTSMIFYFNKGSVIRPPNQQLANANANVWIDMAFLPSCN